MSSSRRSANSANASDTPDLKDVYDPQVSPANYLSNPGGGSAIINGTGTDDATGLSFGTHHLSRQQQQHQQQQTQQQQQQQQQ